MSRSLTLPTAVQQPHCSSSDLPTPGSIDTLQSPQAAVVMKTGSGQMRSVSKTNLGKPYDRSQMPYHFEFVKASILLSIGLYMALSGFLAYMFIKQQVVTDVENMETKFMATFLTFLACFFFVMEIILFFGFVAVSKENFNMSISFAVLMTILCAITLFLGAPTAIVFTGLITSLSWWFVALLRQAHIIHAGAEQQFVA